MGDFDSRIHPTWRQELTAVLDAATTAGATGVLVFDLDSTVFDNRPRQARIMREYGAQAALNPLTDCQPHHFNAGWDLRAAMVACGLTREDAEQHYKPAKKFWGERFFTSRYCEDDVAEPGASEYLHACVATGAQLVYVTGRYEGMRKGTERCMEKCGMPMLGGRVQLLMKPRLFEEDDDFKRVTHARLAELGRVIAAFDNEPTHANDYAARFPEATIIHLATDHSGRPVTLDARIISVPHFALKT